MAAVLSSIIIVLAATAIVTYIEEFSQMVYKERAYHLNETAAQITRTVDTALDEQWSILKIMTVRFPAFDSLTTEECVSRITRMENELQKDGLIFGIVDENGNVFASNEDNRKFSLEELNVTEINEKTLAILKPVKDSENEYMTFVMKNEAPVTLGDGRVITHSVVFWEMDYYKKLFHNLLLNYNLQLL